MFEALLEKVLLNKLGKFILGLDREKLKIAIWKGDITLHDVRLNPASLLKLQLPFILSFGVVSELVIRIPWTKLLTSPIEISLDGLYVLLTPQEKQNWDYSEEGEIAKRKELLENLEKKPEELNPEEEVKRKSFVEKLMGKVIDNIKITVKNIHIRFEYSDIRKFTVGVVLESIESYTTNENWEIHFTDRHQIKSAGIAIYKLLNINGLCIYWNNLESYDKENPLLQLREGIYQKQNYLIDPSN